MTMSSRSGRDPRGGEGRGAVRDTGHGADQDAGHGAGRGVGQDAGHGADRGAHAEAVLSQALRAMAGGRRDSAQPGTAGAGGGSAASGATSYRDATDPARGWWSQLTVTHLALLAAIVGLVLGMAAGFTVLLSR